jgi:uncharacterized cupin superfamily protein
MPKIDIDAIAPTNRTGYPAPYDAAVQGRWYRRLATAGGLSDFGVSHVVLEPGAASSQRHWHEGEDEFCVILSGHAVLIDDQGRTLMGPGDCAAFPKNDGNGHQLINESDADCVLIAIGVAGDTPCHYPDIDVHIDAEGRYWRKDGTAY